MALVVVGRSQAVARYVDGLNVETLLADARELVVPVYRALVEGFPAGIRNVVGYHAGWWDADGRSPAEPVMAGGKAMRPAFVLMCARAAGGDESMAMSAAVAVELVHDFSLLHDDVMDGDVIRRRRPTVWSLFGVSEAILVGDVLAVVALEQVADVPGGPVRVLSRALVELCAGQWADIAFERRERVSIAECLEMAEGKTGALLGAAGELGALAGGADPGRAGCYREFGRQLGVAFQLVDDQLGIWGDSSVTGKPVGADLAARKKSLPVVAALASGSRAGEQLATLFRRDEPLDDAAVAWAAELVETAGGRTWACAEADRRLTAAFAALDAAEPDPQAAAELHALAGFLVHRDH